MRRKKKMSKLKLTVEFDDFGELCEFVNHINSQKSNGVRVSGSNAPFQTSSTKESVPKPKTLIPFKPKQRAKAGRLSEEDVIAIKKSFNSPDYIGDRNTAIKYGCSETMIWLIKKGKVHKSILVPSGLSDKPMIGNNDSPELQEKEVLEDLAESLEDEVEDQKMSGLEESEKETKEVHTCHHCTKTIIAKNPFRDRAGYEYCGAACYRGYINSEKWKKDNYIDNADHMKEKRAAGHILVDLSASVVCCTICNKRIGLSDRMLTDKVQSEVKKFKENHIHHED